MSLFDNPIVIDVETTKKPRFKPWRKGAYLVSVSICRKDFSKESWVFNHKQEYDYTTQQECIRQIQEELDNATYVIGHNLKFDIHWLNHVRIIINPPLYCTQVAEYIINGQRNDLGYSLNESAKRHGVTLKLDKVKEMWDAGFETDEIPLDILLPYGEGDCHSTMELFLSQQKQIQKLKLQTLIHLEMAFLRELIQTEQNGMKVSFKKLKELSNEYTEKIEKLSTELFQLFGHEFNLDSPDQLSAALYSGTFKVDGYETITRQYKAHSRTYQRKTKIEQSFSGAGFTPLKNTALKKEGLYSTAAPILKQLKCRTKKQKRIIELLQTRAKYEKLKGTYFEGLQKHIGENGLIHGDLNQTITVTSRLSSSQPNLQNLPRDNTGPVKTSFITRF